MKVNFNTVNPSFNGCYRLPRAEFDSWEKLLTKNLDRNNQWNGICANLITSINCMMPVGCTYMAKKAGPVMYIAGRNGLDYIIEEAKRELWYVGPTKKESKEFNIPRKRRYKVSELDKLNELMSHRLEKAREMGIDVDSLHDNSKNGVYIFTGKEDAQDYYDYITNVCYNLSHKYTMSQRTLRQKIADIFKPKDHDKKNKEDSFYRNLREIADENNYQQKIFDDFLAKKEVKEFNTAEELAKEIF